MDDEKKPKGWEWIPWQFIEKYGIYAPQEWARIQAEHVLPQCSSCGLHHASVITCEQAKVLREAIREQIEPLRRAGGIEAITGVQMRSPEHPERGRRRCSDAFPSDREIRDNELLQDMKIWPVKFDSHGRIKVDERGD